MMQLRREGLGVPRRIVRSRRKDMQPLNRLECETVHNILGKEVLSVEAQWSRLVKYMLCRELMRGWQGCGEVRRCQAAEDPVRRRKASGASSTTFCCERHTITTTSVQPWPTHIKVTQKDALRLSGLLTFPPSSEHPSPSPCPTKAMASTTLETHVHGWHYRILVARSVWVYVRYSHKDTARRGIS